jgi:hypothetical protein
MVRRRDLVWANICTAIIAVAIIAYLWPRYDVEYRTATIGGRSYTIVRTPKTAKENGLFLMYIKNLNQQDMQKTLKSVEQK